VTVAQKVLAQAVLVVGAAGGAVVNVAFLDHDSAVAPYAFGRRQRERRHGAEAIQAAYLQATRERPAPAGG
jgi:hypothetical protein